MAILSKMQLMKSGSPPSVKMDGSFSQKIRKSATTRELDAQFPMVFEHLF